FSALLVSWCLVFGILLLIGGCSRLRLLATGPVRVFLTDSPCTILGCGGRAFGGEVGGRASSLPLWHISIKARSQFVLGWLGAYVVPSLDFLSSESPDERVVAQEPEES